MFVCFSYRLQKLTELKLLWRGANEIFGSPPPFWVFTRSKPILHSMVVIERSCGNFYRDIS